MDATINDFGPESLKGFVKDSINRTNVFVISGLSLSASPIIIIDDNDRVVKVVRGLDGSVLVLRISNDGEEYSPFYASSEYDKIVSSVFYTEDNTGDRSGVFGSNNVVIEGIDDSLFIENIR